MGKKRRSRNNKSSNTNSKIRNQKKVNSANVDKRVESHSSSKKTSQEKKSGSATPKKAESNDFYQPATNPSFDWFNKAFSPANLNRTLIGFFVMFAFFGAVLGYSYDQASSFTGGFRKLFHFIWWITGFLVVIRVALLAFDLKGEFSSWMNIILVFAIPLSFAGFALSMYMGETDRYYRLFVVPKIIPLYISATILAVFISWELFKTKSSRYFLKNPIFIIFGLFFIWLLINTATSIMPKVTFFGSVVRQMGVITVISFMLSAIGAALWIKGDKKKARLILYIVLLTGLLAILRTHYEMTLNAGKSLRPSGYAGNPDFNGSHYIFLTMTSFFMFFASKSTASAIFTSVMFALSISALMITGTRGAVFGIVFSSVTSMFVFRPEYRLKLKTVQWKSLWIFGAYLAGFLFYYLFLEINLPQDGAAAARRNQAIRILNNRLNVIAFAFISIMPIFVGLIWSAIPFGKQNNKNDDDALTLRSFGEVFFNIFSSISRKFKYKLGIFTILIALAGATMAIKPVRKTFVGYVEKAIRVKSMFDPVHGEPRFILQPSTFPMIKKNALHGVGLENFRVGFLKYKSFNLTYLDPGVNYRSAHNMYLDAGAMLGIPGLLLYLSILIFGLWVTFFKIRKNSAKGKTYFYGMAIGTSLVGYMAHSIFSYDVIPTAMFMYTYVGIAAGIAFSYRHKLPAYGKVTPWNTKSISSYMTPFVTAAILLVFTGAYLLSHHRGDLSLSKLMRSSAFVKYYLNQDTKLNNQARSASQIGKRIDMFARGNKDPKLISTIAKTLRVPLKSFKNPNIGPLLRKKLASLQKNIARRRRIQNDRMVEPAKKVWKYAHIAHNKGPQLGYHSYMAGHMSQVLLRLPGSVRKEVASQKEIEQFLLETSYAGTKNNTNPESAYSRLASLNYTLGLTAMKSGQDKLAYKYYKNALNAVSNSIANDRLYYDTHRIRGIFYFERFCDLDNSYKEFNAARRILQTSRKMTAKKSLRPYPTLYIDLAQAYFEKAQMLLSENKSGEVPSLIKKIVDIAGIIYKLNDDATKLNIKLAKNNAKRLEFLNQNIRRLKLFKTRYDKMKAIIAKLPNTQKALTKTLDSTKNLLAFFMNPKRNRAGLYQKCLTRLNRMKGN